MGKTYKHLRAAQLPAFIVGTQIVCMGCTSDWMTTEFWGRKREPSAAQDDLIKCVYSSFETCLNFKCPVFLKHSCSWPWKLKSLSLVRRNREKKAMSRMCFLNFVDIVAIYLREQHHNKNNVPLHSHLQTSCSVLKRGKLISPWVLSVVHVHLLSKKWCKSIHCVTHKPLKNCHMRDYSIHYLTLWLNCLYSSTGHMSFIFQLSSKTNDLYFSFSLLRLKLKGYTFVIMLSVEDRPLSRERQKNYLRDHRKIFNPLFAIGTMHTLYFRF